MKMLSIRPPLAPILQALAPFTNRAPEAFLVVSKSLSAIFMVLGFSVTSQGLTTMCEQRLAYLDFLGDDRFHTRNGFVLDQEYFDHYK